MKFQNKIIILIITFVFVWESVFILQLSPVLVKTAAAVVVPVFETNPALLTPVTTTAVSVKVGLIEKIARWLKEDFVKALRDIIAKRLMDYIVNETIKWIQGGGKPKFIGNWEGFVKDAGDIAFDSAIREVGLAKLCSPFGLQIQIGLLPVEDFGQRITCTLDKVVSNIENFYVDFSVGGWRGYNLIWQPENNYYGVTINIADAIIGRKAEKTKAAESEGLAGSGFMGDKICKAGSGKTKEIVAESAANYTEVSEDGQYVFNPSLDEAMNSEEGKACQSNYDTCAASANSEEAKESCYSSYEGCINKAETHTTLGKNIAKEKGYGADRSGEYCDSKNMVDATPGSMIGKAVGESITSDSKWAASIQSWVSALVNAVINRVIKEGVGMMQESLGGDKKDSYYPAEYGSMLGQEWEKDKQQMYGEINKFTSEWQYLLDAKNQSLSRASSTLAVLQQLQQIQLTASSTLPSACEPLVTAQDIQTVQNDIDRLTIEIQAPQAKISAADSAKAAINVKLQDLGGVKQVAPDEFQRAAAQTAYQDFINQYGTTAQIEAIVSGSDRQAADTEKQNKQTELDNVQTRLNACQAAINPPPAP